MSVCYNDNECGIVVVHLESKELSRPFLFKGADVTGMQIVVKLLSTLDENSLSW